MATNKLSKEEQIRFLNMAKQFNWNLSNIPRQQKCVSSRDSTKSPQNKDENINNTAFHSSAISSFSSHNKFNTNTTEHSVYDSEATESEDDLCPRKLRPPSEKYININSNALKPRIPLQYTDEIRNKQHDSSSGHHIQASMSSITLQSPITTNNNNHSTLCINTHNNTKVSPSSSLQLTKENLSKFNTSLHENGNKSIHSFSSSSVLSKHNFTLLDISSSDDERQENSKTNTPQNNPIQKSSSASTSYHRKSNHQYFTKYSTKNSGFLDLCSSEDDEDTFHSKENKNDLISSFTDQIRLNKDKISKQATILQASNINKTTHSNTKSHILCNQTLTSKQFKKEREQYTLCFFHRLNENAFDSELILDDNVTYAWCKTLNKTAGDCRLITRNKTRKAHIRLAVKVLDTLEKLKQTLCHEMCHAMAWIVHSSRKPPHGKHFRYWANKAELAFHDIRVTTCHNYKIQYKFQWKCTQCQYVYGRHSKSIKPETHRCGVCKGKLEFLGRLKADGTFSKTQKKVSAFTVFMKQNMAAIKKQYPGAKHGDVMKILSEKYKLSKNTTDSQ